MTRSDWRSPGRAAVITGGASGIGLAAARALRAAGMNVLIADIAADALSQARQTLLESPVESDPDAVVLAEVCDVSERDQVQRLCEAAYEQLGAVHCVMNNAGAGFRVGKSWENHAECRKTLDINLWGIIHGCQAFVPRMLDSGQPGVVINTGSKQGITRPPGNYAYNLSKAGVLAYSEGLAHDLAMIEDGTVSAHLLVPGFTYTGMISRMMPEKPPSAWTPEQTVAYMLERLDDGDFYILCPDNDVTRALDEKRIQWNADDLIKNRPALSRWHPDWQAEYESFVDD